MSTFTFRRLVYLILILCLIGTVPYLIQHGLANAYHFKSRYYIDKWETGEEVTQLQYSNALLASQYATKIDSYNPHYLLTQAKVLEWGVFAQLAVSNSEKFNELYLEAINLRAAWPNAYSDYAYNLAFIQSDLTKSWKYLLKAREYGPYTPEVIRQTLAVGLGYWNHLDVNQKQNVLDASLVAGNADWRMREHFHRLVSSNNLQIPVCRYFRYQLQPVNANTVEWMNRHLCHEFKLKEDIL